MNKERTNKMSDAYTIYHNPRCSKSRLALRLLRRKCDGVEVVKYLETPPPVELLQEALKNFGRRDMLRRHEDAYREHIFSREKSIQDEELAALMHQHPEIIQRPLVVAPDGRMALGRPPENVEEIL